MQQFPQNVQRMLHQASNLNTHRQFVCTALNPEFNDFVELWAPRIYAFVFNALGPYGLEPLPEIKKMADGYHIAGATASFDPATGQIHLATSIIGNHGRALEKLTHEITHASLSKFPEDDDGFYTEGYVDYSVWIMAHAPLWTPYREAMIKEATYNIQTRKERAIRGGSNWDKKRYAGGLFASQAYGPYMVARLKQKKLEGDFTW